MFQKIAKHRANDASNDVHRPPLLGGLKDSLEVRVEHETCTTIHGTHLEGILSQKKLDRVGRGGQKRSLFGQNMASEASLGPWIMFSVKLAPLALLFLTNRTSQLSTLLGNFVYYWKKLYNTLFCSDKNEPPAKVSRWIFCSFPDPQWVLLQFSAGGQDVYQDLLFHHFVCKVTPVHILLDLVYLHLAHLTIFLRIFERTKKNWSIPEKILQNAVQMCWPCVNRTPESKVITKSHFCLIFSL